MESELALIRWMRQTLSPGPRLRLGLGDDAAVAAPADGACVITSDMIVEGVHFDSSVAPFQVGWKAAASGLSDVAAMGGRADHLLVCAGIPPARPSDCGRELLRGVLEVASKFAVDVAGGDTVASPGGLVVAVSVIGSAPNGVTRRDGAQIGDVILVTGQLGGSQLGHHLHFLPRLNEAAVLQATGELHAMIDLSDGLAADLGHVTEESGVGAVVRAEAVPISPAAGHVARSDDRSPLEHALHDGEDFELLFTVSPPVAQQLLKQPPFETPLTGLGTIIESGLWLESADGSRRPLPPTGYEHFPS